MELPQDYYDWIQEHCDGDTVKLRLKYASDFARVWWLPIAVSHIGNLNKARKKLVGRSGQSLIPDVLYPDFAVEQASSYETATLHADILEERFNGQEIRVLDLTGGLGIDARAFADRGWEVTVLEIESLQAEIATYNFRKYANVKVVNTDCANYLQTTDLCYDAIFVDPARRSREGKRFYGIEDCSPNLIDIMPLLKNRAGFILAKLSPMLDLTDTMNRLQGISRLHIVGSKGECKELLAEFDFKSPITSIDSVPIVIDDDRKQGLFSFTLNQEWKDKKKLNFCIGSEGEYVYVPSSVIMKAGCFGSLAARYELTEAAPNSHIFFSREIIVEFPGKAYKIQSVLPWGSSILKNFHKNFPQCEVSVRNFPFSAAQLSAKLKVKPSSEFHLFATTDVSGSKILILTRQVSSVQPNS